MTGAVAWARIRASLDASLPSWATDTCTDDRRMCSDENDSTSNTTHVEDGCSSDAVGKPTALQSGAHVSEPLTACSSTEVVPNDSADAVRDHKAAMEAKVKELVAGFVEEDVHVKFMLEELDKAGCPFPKDLINVTECSASTLGGFIPASGIVVCYNNYQNNANEMRNTIVHELVHAYDHCRARTLDWMACKHLACSEVRAANLSGDCTSEMEWLRGRYPVWPGYQKSCVRRRAEMSVSLMPNCHNQARTAVAGVMEDCYKDTAPYSRAPH